MYTYQFRSMTAVCVLWLMLGVGCHKDPEPQSCKDGTCCNSDKAEYVFSAKVENEPADLIADEVNKQAIVSIYLNNGYPTVEQMPDAIYRMHGGLICSLSASKLEGLAPSAELEGPFTYKYRVWGNQYNLHAITLTGAPITYFYITRIEKAP